MKKDDAGKEKTIVSNVSSRFGISPDGSRICFARKTRSNDHGYLRGDLFLYSLESKKGKEADTRFARVESRVVPGRRAESRAW